MLMRDVEFPYHGGEVRSIASCICFDLHTAVMKYQVNNEDSYMITLSILTC